MRRNRVVCAVATAMLLLGGQAAVGAPPGPPPPPVGAAAARDSSAVHFTAAGDFAATTDTAAVLDGIQASGSDLTLALGDLSYGDTPTEAAWCDFVKAHAGATHPFELISGNHESNGADGSIDTFAACLPNRLPELVGTYARQWYADVPVANPLVRFIMISPDLRFPDGTYTYTAGSPRYNWTAAAIDDARASGVKWVVVGYHKPCLAMTSVSCSSGPDLMNLLVDKQVDLVLTGHNHIYDRTKQLALSAGCPAIVPGTFSAACVADSDNTFTQGAGTVFSTLGTGGTKQDTVRTDDPERGYFAAYSGRGAGATWGMLDVTADANQLSATFARQSGGQFADHYTIVRQPTANTPPVAAFSSAVPGGSGLSVNFDGAGSSDPDGSVTSYAWDFGDGTTGAGATPSHTYATAGTYQARLTVTDNAGATGTVTHPVTVTTGTPPAGSVGFVGAADSNDGASRFKAVTVPSGAKAGDTMVVFLTRASSVAWTGPTGVGGLDQLDSFATGALTSTVWSKTLTATDLGKTVRVDAPKYSKAELSAAVYSGVNEAGLTAASVAHTSDTHTASHASAALSVPAGAWAVTYWADKSASTTAWTAPVGVTTRDTSVGVGAGRYGSLLVDSGRPLPAGAYGPKAASTNAPSYDAASFTIALTPGGGGTANAPPVAAFSSTVSGGSGLSVNFDGSGSSGPDGSIASYAWDFGDGTTGSGATPSHPYATAATYQARLTVTDNHGATGTVTHPVTVTSSPPPTGALGFVAATHSDDGASRFKTVTVPAGAKTGNTLLVFLTRASSVAWTGPTGVTSLGRLDSFTTGGLTSTVWSKTLTATDLGKTVRVDAPKYSKAVLSAAAYTGVNGAALTTASVAHTGDTGTTTHTSAPLTVPTGAWALTYWADKSGATTGWTAPAATTTRDTSAGIGAGRYGSLLVDSGGPLPASTYGPTTATTNATSNAAASFTIALTAP